MKLEHVAQVAVFYEPAPDRRRKVGRLARKQRQILFEYDAGFLGSKLELSPFRLRLAPGCDGARRRARSVPGRGRDDVRRRPARPEAGHLGVAARGPAVLCGSCLVLRVVGGLALLVHARVAAGWRADRPPRSSNWRPGSPSQPATVVASSTVIARAEAGI